MARWTGSSPPSSTRSPSAGTAQESPSSSSARARRPTGRRCCATCSTVLRSPAWGEPCCSRRAGWSSCPTARSTARSAPCRTGRWHRTSCVRRTSPRTSPRRCSCRSTARSSRRWATAPSRSSTSRMSRRSPRHSSPSPGSSAGSSRSRDPKPSTSPRRWRCSAEPSGGSSRSPTSHLNGTSNGCAPRARPMATSPGGWRCSAASAPGPTRTSATASHRCWAQPASPVTRPHASTSIIGGLSSPALPPVRR